jgi:hypothetical protein
MRRLFFSLALVGIAFAPWAYAVMQSALAAKSGLYARLDWIVVPKSPT